MARSSAASDSEGRDRPSNRLRHRQTRNHRESSAKRRSKLRFFYFGLASVWGFLIGTASILGTLTYLGRPVQLDPLLLALLASTGLVALAGGGVAAAAYREAAGKSGN